MRFSSPRSGLAHCTVGLCHLLWGPYIILGELKPLTSHPHFLPGKQEHLSYLPPRQHLLEMLVVLAPAWGQQIQCLLKSQACIDPGYLGGWA
jgi:hypothetical protein